MIGYVTLGTNDKPRAEKFYDELLKEIGAKRFLETDQFTAWSVSPDTPGISVTIPYDGKPASIGNGVMVAMTLENSKKVDQFYDKAISLGATDEGKPGPRGDSGFYAAYFRDLGDCPKKLLSDSLFDGHKLNAFCFTNNS